MALFACKVGGAEGKDGVVKIGTYNDVTNIDVSAYNASSADEFLASVDGGASTNVAGFYWQHTRNLDGYQSYDAAMTAPTLTLNGTTLTVTPAKITGYNNSTPNQSSYANTSVYYVGAIS